MASQMIKGTELQRLLDLLGILTKHGFGEVIRATGLSARFGITASGAQGSAPLPTPDLLRVALEEMGPTFVKLGQILSTRVDLLPPEYISALEQLRDKAPMLTFEALTTELQADLGHPVEDLFAELSKEPLAAGSIAQVHAARLPDGSDVIVKIRRPGIGPVIEADLRLLRRAARLAVSEWPDLQRFRPEEILDEFARSIRSELDLANEGRNAERIAGNFRGHPYVNVPRIHWDWTSAAMNVQDRAQGLPGSDLEAVRAAGLDVKLIARRGAEAVLKMIFEDRLFHADPHGGNVFYGSGERLTFIDFGMVGHLPGARRDELVDGLMGVIERRPDKVAEVLLDWAGTPGERNTGLERDLALFIDKVHGVPLGSLDLSQLIFDVIAITRNHELTLPGDLTLLVKAFVSLDGMGRGLDPELDIVGLTQPFLQRLVLQRYAPEEVLGKLKQVVSDGAISAAALPADLGKLVRTIGAGKLTLGIEMRRIEHISERLNRSLTQLTMGIVIGALTIGSSIVTAASGSDLPFGLETFAMLGFFGAVLGGFWLLISFWRNR